MRRAPCLTLLALLLVGATAFAEEREVRLFRPAAGGFALDDLRLADAIRIHTRDVSTGEPGTDGRLMVWYEGSRDKARQVTVTLYVQPPGHEGRGQVVRVSVRGRLDDSLYRALALKVRAALVGDPTLARVAAPPPSLVPSPELAQARPSPVAAPKPGTTPSPSPSLSPSPSPSPSPLPLPTPSLTPTTATNVTTSTPGDHVPPRGGAKAGDVAPMAVEVPTRAPSGDGAARYSFSSVARGALGGAQPLGVVLELGPRLLLSDGSTRARPGGSAVAALSVGTLYEITLGFAYDQAQTAGGQDGRVEARVWPIFSSLRLLHRDARFSFGGGPRLGLAVVRASARAGTDAGSALGTSTRVTATLGGETLLRYRLWRGLQIFLGLSLDVHLSRVMVRVDETPTLDAGRLAAAGILAVAFTYP